jgi:GntR family transcriptional regulator
MSPPNEAGIPAPASVPAPAPVLVPAALDLNRRLPLWYQVAQHLRAAILSRRPGDPGRLPTEEDLAVHYGVSVVTMRQALKGLEEEGLIERRRRHGTFVTASAAPSRPLTLLGSVDAVVAQQSADEVDVLRREEVAVPAELAACFPDAPNLVFFRRLRKERGRTVSCADNWVRPEHAAAIEESHLRAAPMTQALRDRAGVRIGRFDNSVEAMLATPDLVGLLDVGLLSPILLCTCLTYDVDGRAVDAARIYYRGDRFRYSVTLQAE